VEVKILLIAHDYLPYGMLYDQSIISGPAQRVKESESTTETTSSLRLAEFERTLARP
jgi:hypothetical protein